MRLVLTLAIYEGAQSSRGVENLCSLVDIHSHITLVSSPWPI